MSEKENKLLNIPEGITITEIGRHPDFGALAFKGTIPNIYETDLTILKKKLDAEGWDYKILSWKNPLDMGIKKTRSYKVSARIKLDGIYTITISKPMKLLVKGRALTDIRVDKS